MKERFKGRWLLFMLVFLLSLGGAVSVPSMEAQASTVYVTRTGSKYHAYKCGNGTYYPASLEQALARGLTPCSKCYASSYTPPQNDPPVSYDPPAPQQPSEPTQPAEPPAPVKPMKLSKKSLLLLKGQSATLKVSNAPAAVSWSSSKKSVASVSAGGKVTARKKGTATITAVSGSSRLTCKITVEDPRLNASRITLKKSATKKLTLSGCKHKITWSSSNSSVAKVKNGVITAREPGAATITAKVHGRKFKCKVTVTKPRVQKITLKPGTQTMGYNKTETLKVTLTPKNAQKYHRLTVKSSDKSIVTAKVSDDRRSVLLSSKKKTGTATVTVTAGGVKAKCKVKVIPGVIQSLSLSDSAVSLKPDGQKTISYQIAPYDADTYYTPVWSSSNPKVVTVESGYWKNEGHIQAVGEGTATVTLKIGNASASCQVSVAKPNVTSLKLSDSTLTLKPDGKKTVSYIVAPYDADNYHTPVWSSSDPHVVTVESGYWKNEGHIQAVGEGTATITLTLGNSTAACQITVAKPTVTSLKLNKPALTLKPNQEDTLSYSVAPYDADDYHTPVWRSSDPNVVTVENGYQNNNAYIQAVGEGTATITLTLGNASATCQVTVTAASSDD